MEDLRKMLFLSRGSEHDDGLVRDARPLDGRRARRRLGPRLAQIPAVHDARRRREHRRREAAADDDRRGHREDQELDLPPCPFIVAVVGVDTADARIPSGARLRQVCDVCRRHELRLYPIPGVEARTRVLAETFTPVIQVDGGQDVRIGLDAEGPAVLQGRRQPHEMIQIGPASRGPWRPT